MTTGNFLIFGILEALGSICTAYILVKNLDKFFSTRGLSLIGLGLVSALAADTPEITSAITAIITKQPDIGTGVIVGSNIFNLATLIGVTTLINGKISFQQKSAYKLLIFASLNSLFGIFIEIRFLTGYIWFLLSVLTFAFYILSIRKDGSENISESKESLNLQAPTRFSSIFAKIHKQTYLYMVLLVGIIIALSVAAERSFSNLGHNLGLSQAIVGDIILAAITSLPNAVAALYLAKNVNGDALLSEAFNSNTINLAAGILLPAAIFSSQATVPKDNILLLINLIITTGVLIILYLTRQIYRSLAIALILGYIGFIFYVINK